MDIRLIFLTSLAILLMILWVYVWRIAKDGSKNRKLSEEEQWMKLWETYIRTSPWPMRREIMSGVQRCLKSQHECSRTHL